MRLDGMIDDRLTAIARRADRHIRRQHRHDVEIVESVVRILEHPGHQRLADRLRNLIMKGD